LLESELQKSMIARGNKEFAFRVIGGSVLYAAALAGRDDDYLQPGGCGAGSSERLTTL
jgi:hypothetical protein